MNRDARPPAIPSEQAAGTARAWPAPWSDVGLVAGLALAAHLLFSSLGFNPTDDGFVLSMSRRLIDGQVPHRDFISIRPVGSAVLHVPLVLLAGDAVYWIGRLVAWCELAVIAWVWVVLLGRLTGRAWSWGERAILTAVALIFSSHTFPVMPWYTLDGLLLASLGLLLAGSTRPGVSVAGCLLLGASALCKQNFLAVVPLGALFFRPARRARGIAAAVAPLLAYAGYLVLTDAYREAGAQLGATTGIGAIVLAWLQNPFLWSGAAAGLGIAWMLSRAGAAEDRIGAVGVLATCGLLLCAAVSMLWHQQPYLSGGSFLVSGAALGLTLARARRGGPDATRAGALVLLVSWGTSVSLGYISPALMTGALAVYVLARVTEPGGIAPGTLRLARDAILATAMALALVWGIARSVNLYRDRPVTELAHRLDGVLPGGRFIRTNRDTYAMIADLQRAIAQTGGRPFALVPSLPGYWAAAPQRNPLSTDYANAAEVRTPRLFERVTAELEHLRPEGFVILDKVDVRLLGQGVVPLASDDWFYPIVPYVREHFRKVGETEWFELYR